MGEVAATLPRRFNVMHSQVVGLVFTAVFVKDRCCLLTEIVPSKLCHSRHNHPSFWTVSYTQSHHCLVFLNFRIIPILLCSIKFEEFFQLL